MNRLRTILLHAALILMLSGCGGNGGDSGPPTAAGPPTGTLAPNDARRAASQQGLQAARRAAASTPQFGSVTQSSNRTDRASARFSAGPRLRVDITRQRAGTISLDTALHTVAKESITSPVTGRRLSQAVVLEHSASEATLGLVAVDWSSTDSSDYLAGGYWLHMTGDIYEGRLTGAEVGAFVDGPEIRGTPSMPLRGTATYDGLAAGLYASRYGSDIPGVPQGTHELGEFSGDLRLTADFADQTIHGAVTNVSLSYVGETPNGAVYAEVDQATDYRVNLGATRIGSNGTFTGNSISVTHPLIASRTEGSWGGRFSTVDDRAGNPRMVAGTLGGTSTTPGGSTSSFVGPFYGATPESR